MLSVKSLQNVKYNMISFVQMFQTHERKHANFLNTLGKKD